VPNLTKFLNDKQLAVRFEAVNVLEMMGSEEAVSALIQLIKNENRFEHEMGGEDKLFRWNAAQEPGKMKRI